MLMGTIPKIPITVRVARETQTRLKARAKNGLTVSNLVNQAVEAFLSGKESTFEEGRPPVTAEEIEQLLPVLKALDKPVHIGLFLELLDTQQGR